MSKTDKKRIAAQSIPENPVQLMCTEPSKKTSADSLKKDGHTCNSEREFEDIFYVSGSDCFWLVKKGAFKKIKEATALFEAKVLKKEGTNRLIAMSDPQFQVDDLFLTPSYATFLAQKSPEDKKLWDSYQEKIAALKQQDLALSDEDAAYKQETQKKSQQAGVPVAVPTDTELKAAHVRNQGRSSRSAQHQKIRKEIETYEKLKNELKQKALKIAQEFHYTVDEKGRYYDPRESEIQKYLKQYQEARTQFDAQKPTSAQIKALEAWYQQLRTAYGQTINAYRPEAGIAIAELAAKLKNMQEAEKKLTEAVAKLAALGIAMPDFACEGTLFSQWHQYMTDKTRAEQDLTGALEAFTSASAHAGLPPDQVFYKYFDEISRLQQDADKIKKQLKSAAAAMKPPRLLVWAPGDYPPRVASDVVNTRYPLREICSAALSKEVYSYFSLHSIKTDNPEVLQGNISRLKKDAALSTCLKNDGIVALPIQGNIDKWFNDEGAFQSKAFESWLDAQGYKINSLNAHRSRWLAHLETILVRKSIAEWLGPVDETPQAQMVRMVSYNDWCGKIETNKAVTPKLEKLNYLRPNKQFTAEATLASAEVSGELIPLRGEVDLFDIRLPEHAQPFAPIQLKGRNDIVVPLEIGTWQAHFHAKAWGRVGASFKIGRSIEMNVEGRRVGLSGIEMGKATKKMELADVTAFAGLEAGCSLSGALLWTPPQSFCTAQKIQASSLPFSIAAFEYAVKAEAGIGGVCPIKLKYRNGVFKISVAAKLLCAPGLSAEQDVDFALDYRAMGHFIRLMQDALHRCGYTGELNIFADDETFKAYSKVTQLALLLCVDVGLILAQEASFIERVYNKLNEGKNAGLVAFTISGHILVTASNSREAAENAKKDAALKQWARGLSPEALGSLLRTLICSPEEKRINNILYLEERILLMQQLSIARLIIWLYDNQRCGQTSANAIPDQHRYQEAISRMQTPKPADQKGSYKRNLDVLNQFMSDRNGGLSEHPKLLQQYELAKQQLSNHIRSWDNLVPKSEIGESGYLKQVGWH